MDRFAQIRAGKYAVKDLSHSLKEVRLMHREPRKEREIVLKRKPHTAWFGRALYGVAATALLLGTGWITPSQSAKADGSSVQLIIHYWRADGQYTSPGTCAFSDSPNQTTCGWNVWAWDVSGGGAGQGYNFNETDTAYNGVEFSMTLPCTVCTTMGFIIRDSIPTNEWLSKDTPSDRHLAIANGKGEVWVVSGDPTNYYSLQDAVNARSPKIKAAYLDGPRDVTISLNTKVKFSGGSGFALQDMTTGKTIPAVRLSDAYSFPGLQLAVVGTFQHLLKRDHNWNPASKVTRMKQIGGDLYEKTLNLPQGNYQYQIEPVDKSATFPASPVSLDVLSPGPVTFDFVPSTHGVYDSWTSGGQPLPSVNGWATDLIDVHLKVAPNVRDTLTISGPKLAAAPVIPRDVLNGTQYYYSGPLGSTWRPSFTSFAVWSPTATAVQLQLFNTETGPLTEAVSMRSVKGGAWVATVRGNLANWYYLYAVTIDGTTQTGVDPYARDTAVNGIRAMVVNLAATNPPGWPKDKHVSVPNPVNASMYETDVRDFSIDPNSGVSASYQGKYMAFTQHGTTDNGASTGIDSVKALGVKDIELMPTYEFASVDETNNAQQNWGYDPRNYNTPEGQFATNPHGATRITEYKAMVASIHKAGMGVIFDGVYTHVADANTFNPFVNEYYLRTDDYGNYINGTGAGPDLAIERPMVERFVEDSMKYWITQYHVDGFRLDWMSLFGRDPLKKIAADLRKMLPGIVIVGEPWLSGGDAGTQNGLLQSQQVN